MYRVHVFNKSAECVDSYIFCGTEEELDEMLEFEESNGYSAFAYTITEAWFN